MKVKQILMPFGNLLVENETDRELDKREQMACKQNMKKWFESRQQRISVTVSEGLISMESNNILYLTKECIRDECATSYSHFVQK